MWIVRLVFFVLLLSVLVFLFVANAGQTVDLNLFGREFLDLGLYWIVVAAFALGFAAAIMGMGLREFRLRRTIIQLKRKGDEMEKELTDLRSLPLQDLTSETSSKGK